MRRPELGCTPSRSVHGRVFRLAIAVLGIAMLAGCGAFRSMELASANLLFSPSWEAGLGAGFAPEIEADTKILDNAAAQAWVTALGNELVKHSPKTEQSFTFKVTASEEVNAFAIPGGFCYVNIGLLKYADSEAEVAAVVGHEINHVTMRHGVLSLQRRLVQQGGLEFAKQLAGADPRSAAVASAVAGAGGMVATRSFGREDEREADRLGVEAIYKAGFDPRAAKTFFEKLAAIQAKSGGGGGGPLDRMLSTHPATKERIANIEAQVSEYDLNGPFRQDSPEFRRLKSRL